jgi:HEAT repeat protein
MLRDVFRVPTAESSAPATPSRARRSRLPGPAVMVPLLLLVLVGFIVTFFGFLSFDAATPGELLETLRTSTGERRALAAFQLSRLERADLQSGGGPEFVSGAARTFEEEQDHRIRRALALTLGRAGDARAVPALVGALEDPDAETQLYCVWALGAIGDTSAAEPLLGKLQNEDAGIRKMAAFALGQIGNPRAVPALQGSLQDPVPDVTWNAAVALARMGNPSGLPILVPLLDSPPPPGLLTAQQEEELKINIIRSLHRLGGKEASDALRRVAERDPSPRVRGEARRPGTQRGMPPGLLPSSP